MVSLGKIQHGPAQTMIIMMSIPIFHDLISSTVRFLFRFYAGSSSMSIGDIFLSGIVSAFVGNIDALAVRGWLWLLPQRAVFATVAVVRCDCIVLALMSSGQYDLMRELYCLNITNGFNWMRKYDWSPSVGIGVAIVFPFVSVMRASVFHLCDLWFHFGFRVPCFLRLRARNFFSSSLMFRN